MISCRSEALLCAEYMPYWQCFRPHFSWSASRLLPLCLRLLIWPQLLGAGSELGFEAAFNHIRQHPHAAPTLTSTLCTCDIFGIWGQMFCACLYNCLPKDIAPTYLCKYSNNLFNKYVCRHTYVENPWYIYFVWSGAVLFHIIARLWLQ